MGFSKFVVIALLASTTLFASVESSGDCSFDYSSFEGGSQKTFNVILKDGKAAKSHFEWLEKCCNKSVKHISNLDLTKDFNEKVARDFSVEDTFFGYTANFNPKFAKEHIEKSDDVKLIEEDSEVTIQRRKRRNGHRYNQNNHYNQNECSTDVRNNPVFNLDRIDQEKFPLDKKYEFPATAGEGVTIYIVDTGIDIFHDDFKDGQKRRARHGKSTCAGCGNIDDHGHGTHVAGIAGGKTFGVANKVKLVAVKVLNAAGSGQTSEVIAGLSFVLEEHKKDPSKKSVVNMSLGGGFDQATNDAVEKLTKAGVHVCVAAGNDGGKACNVSPASAPTAITVGATEKDSDDLTDFSNFDECVDIFAPGRDIKSAGNSLIVNNDTKTFSGTSQATPHVAGAVALIISEFGNSSAEDMVKTLTDISTKDIIPDSKGSPNVFLRVPRCSA